MGREIREMEEGSQKTTLSMFFINKHNSIKALMKVPPSRIQSTLKGMLRTVQIKKSFISNPSITACSKKELILSKSLQKMHIRMTKVNTIDLLSFRNF
jgi:hypothetical protein